MTSKQKIVVAQRRCGFSRQRLPAQTVNEGSPASSKNGDDSEHCTQPPGLADAASVADVIGIDIEHVNFAAEYKDRVFLPNLCASTVPGAPQPRHPSTTPRSKFKAFLDHAFALGADKIATGHYTRVRCVAADDGADQPRSCCPLKPPAWAMAASNCSKGWTRPKTRAYFPAPPHPGPAVQDPVSGGRAAQDRCAALPPKLGLPNAKKKDSTGICGPSASGHSGEFLNRYIAHKPGPIKNAQGRVLGQHL